MYQKSSEPKLKTGEALKALRIMHGMSLDKLSELTKIDRDTLDYLENSEQNISEEHASILAKVLKTFPGLLLSWNRD